MNKRMELQGDPAITITPRTLARNGSARHDDFL
jgi:hypothetical protein